MDDSGGHRIPQRHVAELSVFFAGLERYYPFGRDDGKGAAS